MLESVAAFRTARQSAEHAVNEFGVADRLGDLIDEFTNCRPDVIVNFCEEFGGTTAGEMHVAAMLETLNIPYTGSPPECLALSRDKARTKWLLSGAGLPTAPFVRIGPGDVLPDKLLAGAACRGSAVRQTRERGREPGHQSRQCRDGMGCGDGQRS